MLEKGRARRPEALGEGVTIVDPVYIEDDVTITDSVIGPNVSISAGTTVTGSTLRDSVVGRDAKLSHVKLVNSLLGDAVVVSGVNGSLSIGDHSEVNGEL